MRCPRCGQESSVEQEHTFYLCRACSFRFRENTQVIRPILPDTVWVERGTGTLVRVLGLEGDSFDPSTAVRYQVNGHTNEPSHAMLMPDFRYYFRPQEARPLATKVDVPCRVGEEWESLSGRVYLILDISKDGMIHITPVEEGSKSFLVCGSDFTRQFNRFLRKTDYSRLLED